MILRPPVPTDAPHWFDFLVEQQAIAYAGIVPEDFTERQQAMREDFLAELGAKFEAPGSAKRVVAEEAGRIVGVAAIVDAPADWEIGAGFVPAPANRELARLYVAPEQHGSGLADQMLSEIDSGEDLYLWLIDGNERARRFYRRHGFVDCDESFEAGESWGWVGMHRMLRSAN